MATHWFVFAFGTHLDGSCFEISGSLWQNVVLCQGQVPEAGCKGGSRWRRWMCEALRPAPKASGHSVSLAPGGADNLGPPLKPPVLHMRRCQLYHRAPKLATHASLSFSVGNLRLSSAVLQNQTLLGRTLRGRALGVMHHRCQ